MSGPQTQPLTITTITSKLGVSKHTTDTDTATITITITSKLRVSKLTRCDGISEHIESTMPNPTIVRRMILFENVQGGRG